MYDLFLAYLNAPPEPPIIVFIGRLFIFVMLFVAVVSGRSLIMCIKEDNRKDRIKEIEEEIKELKWRLGI